MTNSPSNLNPNDHYCTYRFPLCLPSLHASAKMSNHCAQSAAFLLVGVSCFAAAAAFDLGSLNGNNGAAYSGIDTYNGVDMDISCVGDWNNDGFGDFMLTNPFVSLYLFDAFL
jgi:hypothetical protein